MAVAEQSIAEKLYEGMFLFDSGRFTSDPDGVTRHILELLEKAGATIVAHRPWQDGRLAYEIEKHRRGVHYLVYFSMPPAGMTQVLRACKLSELVIRNLILAHPRQLFDAMVEALNPQEEEAEAPAEPAQPAEAPTQPKAET